MSESLVPGSPEDVQALQAPGWLRPWRPWVSGPEVDDPVVSTPVPWVNAECTLDNDWTTFRDVPEPIRAHDERLCATCGERMDGLVAMGVLFAAAARVTSGPGNHPRCMLLAATTCPYLRRRADVVSWLYDGPGVGHVLESDQHDVYGEGEPVDPSCTGLTLEDLRAPRPRATPRLTRASTCSAGTPTAAQTALERDLIAGVAVDRGRAT